MPVVDDDEKPLSSAYTTAEATDEDDDIHKCTAESVKEAHK